MKLTMVALIATSLVFSYAGVQPMATYKNASLSYLDTFFNNIATQASQTPGINQTPETVSNNTTTLNNTTSGVTFTSQPTIVNPPTTYLGINPKTGVYGNYYLGLIKEASGSDVDSYGNFIVLINNKEATNPTYAQLLDFLMVDKTDVYIYKYVTPILTPYYGTAESHIDLGSIKEIIDGTKQPNSPRICADFAERLHNDAEIAGIRCGYVTLNMTGYSDPSHLGIPSNSGHAIDAFETTDRGIVYIDDTGFTDSSGPTYKDSIVSDVKVGDPYNPQFLFPSAGWYIPKRRDGDCNECTRNLGWHLEQLAGRDFKCLSQKLQ